MALPNILAEGKLNSKIDFLFKCPPKVRATIENITYFNTFSTPMNCETYLFRDSLIQIDAHLVSAFQRYMPTTKETPLYLKTGESIKGKAPMKNVVNFMVFGTLE